MTSDNSPDYEVGYCMPPKARQFKAGQSGNPKGRPRTRKIERAFTRQQLRRDIIGLMESTVTVRTAKGAKREPAVLALLQSALNQAIRGDGVSLRFLVKQYGAAIGSHEEELRGSFAHMILTEQERRHSTKFVSEDIDRELNYLRERTRYP